MIHALRDGDPELRSIFEQRKRSGGQLTYELRRFLVERLRQKGSLEYTFGIMQELHVALEKELESLEAITGQKNWMLRILV